MVLMAHKVHKVCKVYLVTFTNLFRSIQSSIIVFDIILGTQGAQGAQGAQGSQGAQGDQGFPGVMGYNGTTGNITHVTRLLWSSSGMVNVSRCSR
jgi:hypothetical protein